MVVVPVEKKNIDRLPIERPGAREPTKSAAHDDDTVAAPFGHLPSHPRTIPSIPGEKLRAFFEDIGDSEEQLSDDPVGHGGVS